MWTHQPGSHRRKVTQEFFHIPFSAVLALIFIARRIHPFLILVDPDIEFLCTHDIIVLHLLVGHGVRENPSSCDYAAIHN